MGFQPGIFSRKAAKTRPFQGGGGHLSPGIFPQGRRALFQSFFPPSFPPKKAACPGPCSPPGLQCEQKPPKGLLGPNPSLQRKRGGATGGMVGLAPPRPNSGAYRIKGRERTARDELTPQRIPSAPRTPGKIRATATARAKDRAGRGYPAESSCACASGDDALREGKRAGRVLSQPLPGS